MVRPCAASSLRLRHNAEAAHQHTAADPRVSEGGVGLFHIPDDSLSAIVHMDMLDAGKLLPAITQASKNLNLGRIGPHKTSRSRSEGRNSLLGRECDV